MSETETEFNTNEGLETARVDKTLASEFIQSLADIESSIPYLKATANCDKVRYFNAQTEDERNQIKGHHNLATYLIRAVESARQDKLSKKQ